MSHNTGVAGGGRKKMVIEKFHKRPKIVEEEKQKDKAEDTERFDKENVLKSNCLYQKVDPFQHHPCIGNYLPS